MSASLRCDGRLFHSPGPSAPNALSPKVLYVRVTARIKSVPSKYFVGHYSTADRRRIVDERVVESELVFVCS